MFAQFVLTHRFLSIWELGKAVFFKMQGISPYTCTWYYIKEKKNIWEESNPKGKETEDKEKC